MAQASINDTAKQLQNGISSTLTVLQGLRELLTTLDAAVRKRLGVDAGNEDEEFGDEVVSSLEEAESMLEEAETSLEEASDFIEHALESLADQTADDDE